MVEMFLRNSYVEPEKQYDFELKLTPEYTDSLPDMQDAPFVGARVEIPHVGIHNFRLPLRFLRRPLDDFVSGEEYQEVEASITGTVSLGADKKGINMSRIIRTFYEENRGTHTIKTLLNVIKAIMENSEADAAALLIKFSYPIMQQSLRTGMYGWQYYDVCFNIDVMKLGGRYVYDKVIVFDFVYSSACPCSYELAEHARKYRNVATVSHSQRSVARLSLLVDNDKDLLYIEDILDMCKSALHTETQVMVKRPDEQAFAELNGTYTKFVEDAARQLYQELRKNDNIRAFRVVCSHLESLHSHDAIAVVNYGDHFPDTLDYHELRSMVK